MAVRDFSILLEKINSNSSKKDLGMVSGFNAYAQYIENVCKTQKGEVVSSMDMGSNFFSFIFNGQADTGVLENSLAAYIQAAIPSISGVRVHTDYASDASFQFSVFYSVYDGIRAQSNAMTFVEVEL